MRVWLEEEEDKRVAEEKVRKEEEERLQKEKEKEKEKEARDKEERKRSEKERAEQERIAKEAEDIRLVEEADKALKALAKGGRWRRVRFTTIKLHRLLRMVERRLGNPSASTRIHLKTGDGDILVP